jgi:hypothetical protein
MIIQSTTGTSRELPNKDTDLLSFLSHRMQFYLKSMRNTDEEDKRRTFKVVVLEDEEPMKMVKLKTKVNNSLSFFFFLSFLSRSVTVIKFQYRYVKNSFQNQEGNIKR